MFQGSHFSLSKERQLLRASGSKPCNPAKRTQPPKIRYFMAKETAIYINKAKAGYSRIP